MLFVNTQTPLFSEFTGSVKIGVVGNTSEIQGEAFPNSENGIIAGVPLKDPDYLSYNERR